MLKQKIDGVVLNVANGDKGNAETYYYYFDLLGSGFDAFSMEHLIQATTLTYEASNGSGEWYDITQQMTNGGAASFTVSGYASVGVPAPWAHVRVKALTTNATNSLKLTLSRMRL